MALAGFFGAAAQTTDDSMREWRRLFQVDQQIKLEQDRMTKEFDYREREFNWRQDVEDMRNSLAADTFAMDRLETFYERAMGRWDTMTTEERFALMTSMDEMDFSTAGPMVGQFANSYKSVMEANLRDSMTAPEARQYLAQIMNSEYGTHVPQFVLREALRALEGHDDYDDISDMVTQWSATTAEDRADFMANERVRDFMSARAAEAAVDKMEAETLGIGAQTEYTSALTAQVVQTTGFDADKHPGFMRNLELTNDALEADLAAQLITNEYLGPQLSAQWSRTMAEIREMDNADQMFQATFDSMVSRIAAESGMAESEARVMLASETARISLANLEVDKMEATIDNIKAATAILDSELDLNASITDNNRLANVEARVRIANDLVASGNPELIGAVGRDLLIGVVGEDAVDGLLAELTEIATSNRAEDEKLADVNFRITNAEATFLENTLLDRQEIVAANARKAGAEAETAEWQASVNQRMLEFQEWATKRGFELDADRLALMERELNWRMTQPVGGVTNLSGVDHLKAIDAVNSATRTNPQAIREQWTSFREANLDYQAMLRMNETGKIDPERVRNWLVQYQIDNQFAVSQYTEEQLREATAALEARMGNQAQLLRNQAVGAARAYINVGASGGMMFTQEQLGWDTDLFQSAYANYGMSGATTTEDITVPAAQPFLFSVDGDGNTVEGPSLAPTPPGGVGANMSRVERNAVDTLLDPETGTINVLQANAIWETVVMDEALREAFQARGINGPYEFAEHLSSIGQQKLAEEQHFATAMFYYSAAGNPRIDPKNGAARVAFQQFATNATTNAPRANEVLQRLSPLGLSQEEIDYRQSIGAELPEGMIGQDTALSEISSLLGLPEEFFFQRGAATHRNGRIEIDRRVMGSLITDLSNHMSRAYDAVDVLARW